MRKRKRKINKGERESREGKERGREGSRLDQDPEVSNWPQRHTAHGSQPESTDSFCFLYLQLQEDLEVVNSSKNKRQNKTKSKHSSRSTLFLTFINNSGNVIRSTRIQDILFRATRVATLLCLDSGELLISTCPSQLRRMEQTVDWGNPSLSWLCPSKIKVSHHCIW